MQPPSSGVVWPVVAGSHCLINMLHFRTVETAVDYSNNSEFHAALKVWNGSSQAALLSGNIVKHKRWDRHLTNGKFIQRLTNARLL